MELKELVDNYIYVTDMQGYSRKEYWTVMKPDSDGKYRGDCEDLALTIQAKVDGFKDWELWYCKLNGEGHCFLSRDMAIIDNNTKRVVSWSEYMLRYRVSDIRRFSWLEIKLKMLGAKANLLYISAWLGTVSLGTLAYIYRDLLGF